MVPCRTSPSHDVVVHEEQAKIVGGAPVTGRLYADSGALSCQRIMLTGGASGVAPHHHNRPSELFYIACGAAELLAGDPVISAHQGDLLVVLPGDCASWVSAGQPPAAAPLPVRGRRKGIVVRRLRGAARGPSDHAPNAVAQPHSTT